MKKSLFLAAAFVMAAMTVSQAQPLNRSTPEANLKAAEEALNNGNPYAALEFFEKAYEDNKDKFLAARIAMMNIELRDYEKAEKSLTRLIQRDRKFEFVEYRYWLALSMKYNGKHAEAIDMFKQYMADGASDSMKVLARREIAGCEIARKAKQPENLMVNNLGKSANSPQTESSPSYSNGQLYYTTLKSKEVIVVDNKAGDWFSKVVSTTQTGSTDGVPEYAEPAALGQDINREGWHQGNVSISPDGNTMYFTRVQLAEKGQGLAASQVFYATKSKEGWGAANEVTGVNGSYIAKHPCEGELFGEKVLFFAADMPGGEGGFDLYYCPRKSEGVFGLPVNLGKVINSPGDDVSPFYQEGRLWFSSNGRPTMGGLDVFESQWNGSVWSEPKILPAGINTTLDDQFYSRTSDGMSGYLVSNRPGPNNLKSKTCCDDIYAWELERIKVELALQTFRLKRKGEKENQPLKDCTIGIIDVTEKTSKNVEEKSNPATNSFAFNLEPDKSYVVIASAPGYRPDTLAFNTLGIKKTTKVEKKFTLRLLRKEPEYDTIRINEPIRLDNILYDFNDDKIRPDAEPDLQYLVDLMTKNPEMKIELSSHTDARGNDAYNEDLSQRRAESAKRWLVSKGIREDRIVAKGYGEKVLLNKCANGVECTEEEHQENRRTEFKIIAGPTSIVTEKVEKREKKPTTPAPTGGKQSLDALRFLQELIESVSGNPADKELKFKTERFDFKEVKEGEFVKYEYVFDNIGNKALEIDMVSACECMEVKWTTDKILPGKQGRVEVVFNTLSFKGDVSWDIDVVFKNTDTDGFPLTSRVQMVGKIR